MKTITVHTKKIDILTDFLSLHGFCIEVIEENLYCVKRNEALPVYISLSEESLYFEVDLGNVSAFADEKFYFNLLDMNTEILPVSFGINNSHPEDPRLVLVESRETGDLSDKEILSVFDALELAAEKAETLLKPYLT